MFLLRYLLTGMLVVSGTPAFANGNSPIADSGEAVVTTTTTTVVPPRPKPVFPGDSATLDGTALQPMEITKSLAAAVPGSPLSDLAAGAANTSPPSPRTPIRALAKGKDPATGPTPVTKAGEALSPLRRKCLQMGYKGGRRKPVTQRAYEEALDQHLPAYKSVSYAGERVFLVPGLFDFDQEFYSENHGWISNKQRMSMGMSPICYRAHIPLSMRENFDLNDILRLQSKWTVELHHLDMRMHGYGLLMIVPELHRGNGRAYLVDFSGDNPRIIQSAIPRDERKDYKNMVSTKNGIYMCQDVLHLPIQEYLRNNDDGTYSNPSRIEPEKYQNQRESIWRACSSGEIKMPYTKVPGGYNKVMRRRPVKVFSKTERVAMEDACLQLRFQDSNYDLRGRFHPRPTTQRGDSSKRTKRGRFESPTSAQSTAPIFHMLSSPYKPRCVTKPADFQLSPLAFTLTADGISGI